MAIKPFRQSILGLGLVALCLLLSVARAQDTGEPLTDPPDRAARLSYLSGDISLQPAGEDDWAQAMLNRPLTTGDKLWTERGARAEIQVSQAVVRLDGETGFSFLNLDDDTVQMRITAGTVIVNVRALEDREQIEIATPNVAVNLLRPGSYRIEVNDAGDVTTVKIGDGEAEAIGPATNTLVHSRQAVTFRGVDELVTQVDTLGPADDFDDWSMDRNRRIERFAHTNSSRYVSPDVTGYDDLDEHGTWSSEPEYGYVWTPRHISVDWSPYRYGRWVWVSPWGWTWIDDAPWGYAPFHYGRWAYVRHRWCWVPGPRHVRAVYAPALVGWIGRPGLSVWFPLGPREVYVPWRRFSHRYVERVNISNTVIVNRGYIRDVFDNRARNVEYRNRRIPNAITAAARESFIRGHRIGNDRVRVTDRDLAQAQVSATPPRIDPVRESRLGPSLRGNARVPPRNLVDRPVVVHRDPPPSSARFVRTPRPQRDPGVEQARSPHPQTLAPDRDSRRESPGLGRAAVLGERADRADRERAARADRPPRPDRAASESAPPAQSSVYDRRAISDRVREDRDRQVREYQQQREFQQQREYQREREYPQERQRDTDRDQRQQDALRDAAVRRLEQRHAEQRQMEQRQAERPREYRQEPRQVERPQRAEPRREQPRVEQPRAERAPPPPRPSRSESSNEGRPPPLRGQDHSRRSKD